MNVEYIIISTTIFLVLNLMTFLGLSRDWNKTYRQFIFKKWMDIAVYILTYVVTVFTCYAIGYKGTSLLCAFIILATYNIFLIINQLLYFDKNRTTLDSKAFPYILLSLIVGLISSFAQINFCLYYFDNSLFELNQKMTAFEMAIEFLYYAFTVTITYSNSTITANGVLSKIIQMVYVSFTYFLLANSIFVLIESSKKPKDKNR
ncbi:hypothetical protein [Faecalispora jeddahensis]|uniref:hypothetical protein n=1 Tax=Faecalispora jeddahensis TaxID=1414721 RepID=UPI0028AD0CC1|nr:hypothetical protein [Faecalispora jeddahensis]